MSMLPVLRSSALQILSAPVDSGQGDLTTDGTDGGDPVIQPSPDPHVDPTNNPAGGASSGPQTPLGKLVAGQLSAMGWAAVGFAGTVAVYAAHAAYRGWKGA